MTKGARGGVKVSLKMARARVRVCSDGRRCLDLSKLGLTTFPACVLKLGPLHSLDLSRNRLRSLPALLTPLQGLTTFDLHSNQIESLPETLGALTSLTSLNLANNRLEASGLPDSLASLPELESLNLGMNLLRDLPRCLALLRSLKHLALFDNLLRREPECVSALRPQLHTLNMQRNPLDTHTHTHTHTHASHTHVSTAPPRDGKREEVYLVRGEWLCLPCSYRLNMRKEAESGYREGEFSGLATPNSVAIMTQHVWREAQNTHTQCMALCT